MTISAKKGIPMNKLNKILFTVLVFIIAAASVSCFSPLNPTDKEIPGGSGKPAQSYIEEKQISGKYAGDVPVVRRPAASKKRVNILLLGIEGKARTDTMIFISYDRAGNKLSLISIPRDTYFYEPGYDKGDQRKINSVFGRTKETGCMAAVGKLLGGTSVDYYVSIEYEGVEKIIDSIGGVELEVPMDMKAGGVKIYKGRQVLYGKEALQYLRFRREYPDGDLERIRAHQKLIRAALDKVQYADLPGIINRSLGYVKTNMPMGEMLEFTKLYMEDGEKEVSMYLLPGAPMYKSIGGYSWSYFFHNSEKVKELMNNIYAIESFEQKKRERCGFY